MDKVFLLPLGEGLTPEDSWLLHINVSNCLEWVSGDISFDRSGLKCIALVLDWSIQSVRLIVGSTSTIVSNESPRISLIVGYIVDWAVNWNLLKVRSESVSLGVRIREHSCMKNSVVREFNAWDVVTWVKGDLFHLSMEILRVPVEH